MKTNAGFLKTQDGAAGAGTLLRKAPLATLVATFFGVGFLPVASGTWGSLATLPVVDLLYTSTGLVGIAAFALVTSVAGVLASSRVAALLGKGDPSQIVIDEVAGQALTLLGVYAFCPFPRTSLSFWAWVFAAFLLFRVLDIWKPGPIRRMERLPGGAGIMLDDVLAGFLGGLALAAALILLYRT